MRQLPRRPKGLDIPGIDTSGGGSAPPATAPDPTPTGGGGSQTTPPNQPAQRFVITEFIEEVTSDGVEVVLVSDHGWIAFVHFWYAPSDDVGLGPTWDPNSSPKLIWSLPLATYSSVMEILRKGDPPIRLTVSFINSEILPVISTGGPTRVAP